MAKFVKSFVGGIYHFFENRYRRHYSGVYRHARKLFFFDLGLLALALVMLVSGIFLFFWKPNLTDQIDLSLSVGVGRIKSGETVPITIDYANRTKLNLREAVLSVHLPDGFVIDRSRTPITEFSEQSTVDIGTIPPGAKGQKIIWGKIWTEPKQEIKILSLLSYLPENRKDREQKITTTLLNLPESLLDIKINLPKAVFPDQPTPFSVILSNNGLETIDGIFIQYAWPDKIMADQNLQNITLAPSSTHTFNGTIMVRPQTGRYQMSFSAQLKLGNKLVTVATDGREVEVFNPKVSSAAVLTGTLSYASAGDTVPVTVNWKNNSGYNLKNLRIKLEFTAGTVDLKATARANGLKIEDEKIVADASSRTALADGNPGVANSINVNVALLQNFNLGQIEHAPLEITPTLEAEIADIPGQKFEQAGASLSVPLATAVSWQSEARYYTPDGDQLGRGPLPPQVGATTKYWILVKIYNTTNALSNASFETALPPGVEFTDNQSVTIGPRLHFNPSDRTIQWSYSRLPANSMTGLYFEIATTPDEAQIGHELTLTDKLNFTASDSWIDKKFDLQLPGINNVLKIDDLGRKAGSTVVN